MAASKPLKIIGIIVGVCILLIVAAIITLSIMYPPEKIKALILPHIEKAVGRSVQVEGAGLSFYPVFGIKIKGLSVANTEREGFSDDPFLTLKEFLVKVKIAPLLQKRLDISAIILDRPSVLVEVDRMGSFNYDDLAFMKPKEGEAPEKEEPKEEAPEPGKPALPIPLTMEQFAIKKGRIIYHDMKEGRRIDIGEVNQRVDFSIDKELKDVKSTGELVLSGVSVITREISKPLTGFTVTFSHDVGANVPAGEAVLNSVKASLQKVYIALSGTVKNFNAEPALDLKIKTEKISIAEVLAEIPVELFPDVAKLKAKGFIQLAMILTGTIDASGVPNLKGKLNLGDGHIQYADLPEAITDIRADISFTQNSLVISDFGFNLGKNPVLIKAKIINFAMPDVDALVNATVNLDDIKNIIELPEGVSLSGVIKSDITAKGVVDPNDPMKMDIKGSIAVTNLRAKTPEVEKPMVVNGIMDFSPKQIANKMKIGVGSSDVSITSKITDYLSLVVADSTKKHPRPKLNFNVASSLLNTSDFLAEKTESAPSKETKSEAAPTTAPPKGGPSPILAAPLPALDMKGSISCKRFVYENIEMKNFNTQINSLNDVMNVTTRANMFSGALSNRLNLNAGDLHNVQIANKFDINNIEINDFISSVNDLLSEDEPLYKELKKLDDQIFGRLSLKTDIKCNGATTTDVNKTLNGVINASIDKGKIKSNLFTQGINEKIAGFSNKTKIRIDKLLDFGDIDFRHMKLSALIKDEKVFLDDFDINSSKAGEFDVGGNVGFNGILDISLADRLPRNTSQKILSVQGKVAGLAKGGLKQAEKELGKHIGSGLSKTLGKAAKGQLDKRLITPDKEGRVTMVIGFGGTAAKPTPKSLSFKKHEVTQEKKKEEATPKQELKKKAEERVTEVKKEAEKVIKKETEKVTKEVEKKVDDVIEKTVPKETKKEADKAKDKVKDKLNKFKKKKKLF